jgi:hypothetical protein
MYSKSYKNTNSLLLNFAWHPLSGNLNLVQKKPFPSESLDGIIENIFISLCLCFSSVQVINWGHENRN